MQVATWTVGVAIANLGKGCHHCGAAEPTALTIAQSVSHCNHTCSVAIVVAVPVVCCRPFLLMAMVSALRCYQAEIECSRVGTALLCCDVQTKSKVMFAMLDAVNSTTLLTTIILCAYEGSPHGAHHFQLGAFK